MMDHEDPFGRLGRWDPETKQDLREQLAKETPKRIPVSQPGVPEILYQLNELDRQIKDLDSSLESLLELLQIRA